jgi:hypothetical protein
MVYISHLFHKTFESSFQILVISAVNFKALGIIRKPLLISCRLGFVFKTVQS